MYFLYLVSSEACVTMHFETFLEYVVFTAVRISGVNCSVNNHHVVTVVLEDGA